MKRLKFCGNALDALRQFPALARKQAGHQLELVQCGEEPYDWKPMTTVGSGVREIRVRDEKGIFRVLYVAKFRDAIHVLHCFQKKTQQTATKDIEIAKQRYKEVEKEHKL